MLIDCISDLHGYFPPQEGGDLLIIAGDLTASDAHKHICAFKDWIVNLNYKKVILIAGNHDNWIQERFLMGPKESWNHEKYTYLEDSGTEFGGLKIWGSPWTAWFHGVHPLCKAFMIKEKKLKSKWDLIPEDTDILITHSPPYGIGDGVPNLYDSTLNHVGSKSLYDKIVAIRPKLHVFGHIHEGYGRTRLKHMGAGMDTICVNASYVNERYKPVNKPHSVIL